MNGRGEDVEMFLPNGCATPCSEFTFSAVDLSK